MKGIVYLICDGEHFKIGVTTKTLDERLRELQTGNPDELFVCNYYVTDTPFKLETMLHNRYFCHKIKNEWFDVDSYTVAHFVEICEKYQKIIDSLRDNVFFKAI
jgi:hypothetical protein